MKFARLRLITRSKEFKDFDVESVQIHPVKIGNCEAIIIAEEMS